MQAPATHEPPTACTLTGEALTVGLAGRELVRSLQLRLLPGQFVCMLGPNGVGKTMTLHTLAGLRAPLAGEVLLNGIGLTTLDRGQVARQLGLLLQQQEDPFPTTVLETALLGRHAHLGFWQWESADDIRLARAALAALDLEGLEHRQASQLSGGERRRLAMATLLVQQPAILLLDEPMNHLDPRHQLDLLRLLRRLADEGRAVLASLHDPALAARVADAVLLLHGDGRWQFGASAELLTPPNLETLYGTPFRRYTNGSDTVLLPASPA